MKENEGHWLPSSTCTAVMAAKMLVRDYGSIVGTVGGGCVEADVRKGAMEVMRDEKPRRFTSNLDQRPDDDTGLVCSGSLQIFIEPIIPYPRLYIFGAGHIGFNYIKWQRWPVLKPSFRMIASFMPTASAFQKHMRFIRVIWKKLWRVCCPATAATLSLLPAVIATI
jgi:xanthine/CO dehydrogenase XdhC/CoxF family maturation factor